MARSPDGPILASAADLAPGQAGTRTRFTCHGKDGGVWAGHAGGDVVRSHRVGTREGDRLDFRYVQLKTDGTTASGHCVSTAVELPGGRVRPEKTGERESQPRSGTSGVEEVTEHSR